MAYIAQRGAYWRAEVRRRGFKPTYRTFDTRLLAQQWARKIESEMDAGIYIDRSEAERTTLREALERYRQEIVPSKRHPTQENGRIQRWLATELAYRGITSLRGVDFARYRDARRGEGKAENTIRLELQLLSHLFETARKEWGMEGLANPLKNIRKPGGALRATAGSATESTTRFAPSSSSARIDTQHQRSTWPSKLRCGKVASSPSVGNGLIFLGG